jgi:hypothetical protein
MVTFIDDEGNATRSSPSQKAGSTRTASTSDGRSMSHSCGTARILVSDDLAGALYRISYEGN